VHSTSGWSAWSVVNVLGRVCRKLGRNLDGCGLDSRWILENMFSGWTLCDPETPFGTSPPFGRREVPRSHRASTRPCGRTHGVGSRRREVETLGTTSVQLGSTWLAGGKLGERLGQLEVWTVGLPWDCASMHGTRRATCHPHGRLLDQSGHEDSGGSGPRKLVINHPRRYSAAASP
jgi:hypothetical protein